MSTRFGAVAFASMLLGLAGHALAGERVAVRIGMSMAEIEPYLNRECARLIFNEGRHGERLITCEMADFRLITANLSAKDRITYSVYREPSDLMTPDQFGREIAAELGFEGSGENCTVHRDASLCWSRGTTRFWVYLEADSSGRLAAFQADDAMAEADADAR